MNLNNLTASIMPDNAPSTNMTKNVLSSDVQIDGKLKFTNELIFDGQLEGEIESSGVLTISKNAKVQGEIRTKSVTVYGTVTGNITVEEKCELKASSVLTGDLKAMRIVIEEGATFVGKSEVTPNKPVQRSSDSKSTDATRSSGAGSSSTDASRPKTTAAN